MQYATALVHRLLVRDSVRTSAFYRAVNAVVQPGDVVLDVGAGSGILSLFAARAGARRVYAVESEPIARLAARLAALNRLDGIVHVIEAPLESVSLPERIDVLMSEWLGTIGVDENLLALVLLARDRWLRSGARVMPRRVTAWMAPACLAMQPAIRFFRERPYGLDLTPLEEASVHELLSYRRRISPDDVIARPVQLWETDVATVPGARAALPSRASVQFVMTRRTAVNSLVAWFSAQLSETVSLTNAPDSPDTHWGQLLLPLSRERIVQAGDVISAQLACIPAGPLRSDLAWSVRIRGEAWEHHDTRVMGRNGL
jgi:predicted RNA methylase